MLVALSKKILGGCHREQGADCPGSRVRPRTAQQCDRLSNSYWLFCGSDDYAQSAANIFSLIASCKLHGLEPETYLTEIIRFMPRWPRDRYLEISPRYWKSTRKRLIASELTVEIGPITVPAPLESTEEKSSTN